MKDFQRLSTCRASFSNTDWGRGDARQPTLKSLLFAPHRHRPLPFLSLEIRLSGAAIREKGLIDRWLHFCEPRFQPTKHHKQSLFLITHLSSHLSTEIAIEQDAKMQRTLALWLFLSRSRNFFESAKLFLSWLPAPTFNSFPFRSLPSQHGSEYK